MRKLIFIAIALISMSCDTEGIPSPEGEVPTIELLPNDHSYYFNINGNEYTGDKYSTAKVNGQDVITLSENTPNVKFFLDTLKTGDYLDGEFNIALWVYNSDGDKNGFISSSDTNSEISLSVDYNIIDSTISADFTATITCKNFAVSRGVYKDSLFVVYGNVKKLQY